jgi:hypothetical protein
MAKMAFFLRFFTDNLPGQAWFALLIYYLRINTAYKQGNLCLKYGNIYYSYGKIIKF